MSIRQIVLDTETTGIRIENNHRIIEVGCVEMINRKLTGNNFHHYFNPQREIEAGALAVHGISDEFLKDKPLFSAVADDLIAFIKDAELIIHNAPFDLSFLNNEFAMVYPSWQKLDDYCRIIDTLPIARQLHVGQRNSLDALCKRYRIDNSKREFHGALLDAHLLAQIYLAMTGGQGSFFDAIGDEQTYGTKSSRKIQQPSFTKYQLKVLKADADELCQHEKYLQLLKKTGKCLWVDEILQKEKA